MAAMHGDYEALARVFKALGDKTRLRLVAELARRGQVTCGEFATMCACSDSALTYHQRVLGDAGLIAVRRAGQFRVLTLRRETFEALLPGFLTRLAGVADDADDVDAAAPLMASIAGVGLEFMGDGLVRPAPSA